MLAPPLEHALAVVLPGRGAAAAADYGCLCEGSSPAGPGRQARCPQGIEPGPLAGTPAKGRAQPLAAMAKSLKASRQALQKTIAFRCQI